MVRKKGGIIVKHLKLIKEAKSGNPEAFEELLLLYSNQLYRTAFLYVGNREDALDIVQETTYKAYVAIKNLRDDKYFSTWLTRILINTAYEISKKRKRDVPFEYVSEVLSTKEEFNIEQIDLVRAINELRESYRDAIILFYYHDLPITGVAKIMDIPEGSVKTFLRRGKEQLKTILKGVEYYEGKIISGKI